MSRERRPLNPAPDGVRVFRDPGARSNLWRSGLVLAGLVIVVVSSLVLRGPAPEPEPHREAPPGAVAEATTEPSRPLVRRDEKSRPPSPSPPGPDATQSAATQSAPAQAEAQPLPRGSNLFPDQKRRPYLIGNVVPDGFVLPPGYIRHYQTAHFPDGLKQLPPILMYDFGFQPLDGEGRPLPVPEDRVVPVDRLPPGIPLQKLEIPSSETEGDDTP